MPERRLSLALLLFGPLVAVAYLSPGLLDLAPGASEMLSRLTRLAGRAGTAFSQHVLWLLPPALVALNLARAHLLLIPASRVRAALCAITVFGALSLACHGAPAMALLVPLLIAAFGSLHLAEWDTGPRQKARLILFNGALALAVVLIGDFLFLNF